MSWFQIKHILINDLICLFRKDYTESLKISFFMEKINFSGLSECISVASH